MTENDLMRKADEFIEENIEDIIRDIKSIVDVPSVAGEPTEDAPYGQEVKRALTTALGIADRMGFSTTNCDNHLGFAEIKGREDAYIGTIAHLDVVAAGKGWNTDPFSMEVKDGYLMGRGVVDNKGPLILTFYLGKFFKEMGEAPRYTLRMIAGCDEESGMRDVEYYKQHYPQPVFLITPDSEFPLCNGEKGCLIGNISSQRFENGKILDFCGGVASNVVPDEAYAIIDAELAQCPPAERITVSAVPQGVRIDATGISGHASHAEFAINAIGVLTTYLLQNDLVTAEERKHLEMLDLLFQDLEGHTVGIDCVDDRYSPLTIIGGMMRMENGVMTQNVNSRYPMATSGEEIIRKLSALATRYNATASMVSDSVPFYIEPDKPEIQACLRSYNDVRNLQGKPFTMGGGTYARHFDNAISFGTEIPSEPLPDFVGKIHTSDEGIGIDRLKMSLKIYILTLSRLMNMDL